MLLNFAKKPYSQHICNHSQHICNQSQAILIVGKAFVVVVRRLRFASIRIDIFVEFRTNIDNKYKFEKIQAHWTEAGRYKTKRNTRKVYYAN